MAKRKEAQIEVELEILKVNRGTIACYVVGETPLILNRYSEKAIHQLLLPQRKKNQAEKDATFKHDPAAEFRSSPDRLPDPNAPTLLAISSSAFKGAIMSASIDMPGTKKAQIGRLVWVTGRMTPIYGLPKMFMAMVRSADMNRTPDVRTRAILPEWAARIEVAFVEPLIKPMAIANMLGAAGLYIGIGDWRSEKGKGSHGQFRVVSPSDPDYQRITSTQGRDAQIEAMAAMEPYDDDTRDLFCWYNEEMNRRKMKGVA